MSSMQGARAISLVVNGGIEEQPSARVFTAKGSQGTTYMVVTGRGGDMCTCPAGLRGVECYHAKAAHLLMARERREAAA